MTTEGFGYKTVGETTAKMGPYSRPYLHLIVYSLITLWALYGCNGSAETLQVFGNRTVERMMEQIPLSIGLGYLLYRALDAKLRSSSTGDSGSDWTMALGFVAVGALAGYMLMNYFSAFVKDSDEKAQVRKNTIYQIGNQTLVFTAIFLFIAQWKTPKLRREFNYTQNPKVGEGDSWNGDGKLRMKCNVGVGVLVALAIFIMDAVCIGKTAFGDETWDSATAEDSPVFQMIARGTKALALVLIAERALRFEFRLPLKHDGSEGPVAAGPAVSTMTDEIADRVAAGGRKELESYGYEI